MQPVRAIVHTLTELPAEPDELTLRQLVEWSKRIVREGPQVPTGSERKQIDATFFQAAKGIADREGIPVGYIAGIVHDLSLVEMQLLQTAEAEAEHITGEGR